MYLKTINVLVFVFIVGFAYSQRKLSAQDAVFTALENNFQIKTSEKQHTINEKNNKWSEAGLFPVVSLNVSQSNSISDNKNNPFAFPGAILNQSINPSLNTDWNLFSGLQVLMSKRRLDQLEQQSANNSIVIIEGTIQDVLKAYYTCQLQNERKKLFQSILDLSRERYNYYEIKEQYSSSNTLELLQFKNQYLTDSTNYLTQQISYANSIRNLALLMNDSSLVQQDFVLTDKIDFAVGNVSFSDAEAEMLSNNANLKNQYINLELQQTQTSFQRSFLYPTLSFQAGVQSGWSKIRGINDPNLEVNTQNLSYYGNFNLRYTLFNNWKNKRAVEVSKIQEEIAELNIENIKLSLSNTLKNLVELYQLRLQLVEISQENLVYAKKAFDLAEDRFAIGAINSIDLTAFQNSYQNTMLQHYENLFNKLDTYLEIYKMTGKIGLEYTN